MCMSPFKQLIMVGSVKTSLRSIPPFLHSVLGIFIMTISTQPVIMVSEINDCDYDRDIIMVNLSWT